MFEIQMFDCRKSRLEWQGVTGKFDNIEEAEKELSEHEEDWPSCQFRISRIGQALLG